MAAATWLTSSNGLLGTWNSAVGEEDTLSIIDDPLTWLKCGGYGIYPLTAEPWRRLARDTRRISLQATSKASARAVLARIDQTHIPVLLQMTEEHLFGVDAVRKAVLSRLDPALQHRMWFDAPAASIGLLIRTTGQLIAAAITIAVDQLIIGTSINVEDPACPTCPSIKRTVVANGIRRRSGTR
jgi:hypothetical protein